MLMRSFGALTSGVGVVGVHSKVGSIGAFQHHQAAEVEAWPCSPDEQANSSSDANGGCPEMFGIWFPIVRIGN